MKHLRINKLLVIYTLLIFLGGVFCGGFYLTVKGYDVPWNMNTQELAKSAPNQNQQNTSVSLDTIEALPSIDKIVDQVGPAVVKIETITQVKTNTNDLFLNPFNDPFFRDFSEIALDPNPRLENRKD